MPNRPNILFLLSDEHSFRFLSARSPERGGEPCYTPTLDRLIQQGVHFEQPIARCPCARPAAWRCCPADTHIAARSCGRTPLPLLRT